MPGTEGWPELADVPTVQPLMQPAQACANSRVQVTGFSPPLGHRGLRRLAHLQIAPTDQPNGVSPGPCLKTVDPHASCSIHQLGDLSEVTSPLWASVPSSEN